MLDLFPWAWRLMLTATAPVDLLPSFQRGCQMNHTALPLGRSYEQFAQSLSDSENIGRTVGHIDAIVSLLAPNASFNKHLHACPSLILKAAHLRMLHLYRTALRYSSNQYVWDHSFWEINRINELSNTLQCPKCDAETRAAVAKAILKEQARLASNWVLQQLREVVKSMTDFVKHDMQEANRVVSRQLERKDSVTEEEHFAVMRDGQVIFDRMRADSLLSFWVVARGTMIYAMRYGASESFTLPSGYRDQSHVDFDVYVHTTDWGKFQSRVSDYSREFGFEWCGYHQGWPENTLVCMREGVELDISWMTPSCVAAATPITRCLVAPPRGTSGLPSLELPCPRDPLQFMRQVWSDRPDLVSCLALPRSFGAKNGDLSSADVQALWHRSLELHHTGFASMVSYYRDCHGHEHSVLASQLWKREQGRHFLLT